MPELVVQRNEYEPAEVGDLPGLTRLPVVLPSWWGAPDTEVTAGVRRGERGPLRGYRADGSGPSGSVTVAASAVLPGTLRPRQGDERVPGAGLDVLWSPDRHGWLRGSAVVPTPEGSGTAAAVTVVADGLPREAFLAVLRSLRIVRG